MKIFVIGGHKNGTWSLHNFFINNGLNSVHGNFWMNQGKHFIDKYDCFSDHFAERLINLTEQYKTNPVVQLLEWYPDSIFILNYRDLYGYIKSVCNHLSINYIKNNTWKWKDPNKQGGETIKSVSERIINTHNSNKFIIDYFKKNKLMNRLLVLNILGNESTNTNILNNFLIKHKAIENAIHTFKNVKHMSHCDESIEEEVNMMTKSKIISVKQLIPIGEKEYIDYLDIYYKLHINRN